MLLGFSSQERLIAVLTIALVGASFFLGYFYGQLTILRDGSQPSRALADDSAPQAAAPAPEAGPLSDSDWQDLLVSPAAAKGPEDAAVTIVEFTDYQCPFCSRHFQQTDSLIQENYVETGKVRYIARDLPLSFHANAHAASQAARCAGDQNKYWEMHDMLFNEQQAWSTGDPTEQFSNFAQDIGLDVATFDNCLSSEKYKDAVDADLALASRVGASGTPTFFINGIPLVGAQPYAAFEAAIDAALE